MNNLAQLKESYTTYLKQLGINLNDLPEDVKKQIDLFSLFKTKTNLCDLNKTFVLEWYLTQRKLYIDKQIIINKLKNNITDLQNEIALEETELREYLNFKSYIIKNTKSKEEIETTLKTLQKSNECFAERKISLGEQQVDSNIKEFLKKFDY